MDSIVSVAGSSQKVISSNRCGGHQGLDELVAHHAITDDYKACSCLHTLPPRTPLVSLEAAYQGILKQGQHACQLSQRI